MYTLYVIPGSHACRSAMLMLEHKEAPYRSVGFVTLTHPVAVRLVERADHDPIRRQEVAHRRPLGEELGVRDVADVLQAPGVERGAHLLARADGNGALHHEHGPPREFGQVVEHPPDVREVGVACVRRRRSDADVEELGIRRRLDGIERKRQLLAVPFHELGETGLVEGEPSGVERLDPLLGDVPYDRLVAELGEAGGRDDADPAGAEDPDPAHYFFFPSSRRRPRAIESIVTFESVSRRVFTTQ